MKKTLISLISMLFTGLLFAQTFDASKPTVLGVISASENRKDVIYEITDYDDDQDITYFTYTWTQQTKLLGTSSYTQYKCLINVTSSDEGDRKKLITKCENVIFSRSVNADGSEIKGTPKIKGVSYKWVENTTIMNKKQVLQSVVETVEKQLLEELNKSEEEDTLVLTKFFSDDINLTYFNVDTIGKIATTYIGLSNVPALVFKLNKEKSELWYKKYQEKILNNPFRNTLKIDTVKESDVEGYNYKVICLVLFTHVPKDSMDGQIKAIGESYSTKEARQKAFTTFKSLNSKGISINYYTNDDKVIDMNKNDVIVIDGILKKINTNLFNEIYSFSVYAD